MNCAEFEIALADYLDGALEPAARLALEQHATGCPGCRELFEEASAAHSLLGRVADVDPPSELVTRLAFLAPQGRTRQPFERQGWLTRTLSNWLQPVLQPRLVMGMAMTVLSFAMLERCTGIRVQQIQASDLDPARIWGNVEDKAIRLKDRSVKYYENLRWVYEIEGQLKSLQDQQEALADQDKAATAKGQPSGKTAGGASTPNGGKDKK